ncbi:Skg6p ASCRUDRAFT_87650 [Ascoidea rubescens DSM 1968]|uniref:Uncharacterized protein n=1 Tax=Ascoidea rubescens DSM 1968 TaxID=1344418 RepID=A0A1D2VC59_9ASCO|nr:hypothetical protein ASCRUDRAFT_87650 [Ascoidea rubescens DSM 1968]ODV59205.1 hypothetical protein ASCRUDRAFT_87650 [Ascoidea rubescens DSM 1968]
MPGGILELLHHRKNFDFPLSNFYNGLLDPAVIHHLIKRAKDDDDDDDNSCSDKNNNSQKCEVPSDTTGLTVGLAVGIPIFLILAFLGFFLIKNLQKNKKEEKEFLEDPDFANNDVTNLPDYPSVPNLHLRRNSQINMNNAINNLHNDKKNLNLNLNPNSNSDSNPNPNPLSDELNINPRKLNINTSFNDNASIHTFKYDTVILPESGLSDSRVYLDEYAKALGTHYSAYGNSPTLSPGFNANSRNSSFSNFKSLSPLNSQTNLLNPSSRNSNPVSLANSISTSSHSPSTLKQSVSSSDIKNNKINLNHNERNLSHNKNSQSKLSTESSNTAVDSSSDTDSISIHNNKFQNYNDNNFIRHKINDSLTLNHDNKSNPFEEILLETPRNVQEDLSSNSMTTTNYPNDDYNNEIQNETQNEPQNETDSKPKIKKSVKINIPDGYDPEKYNQINLNDPSLTEEEKEKFKRLKSVYNIYFDRQNSIKIQNHPNDHNLDQNPIPIPSDVQIHQSNVMNNKINNQNYQIPQSYPPYNTNNDSSYQYQQQDQSHQQQLQDANNYQYNPQPQQNYSKNQYQNQLVPEQQYLPNQDNSRPTDNSYTPPINSNPSSQYLPYPPVANPYQTSPQPHQQNFTSTKPSKPILKPLKPLQPLKKLPSASNLKESASSTFTEFQAVVKVKGTPNPNNLALKPFVPIDHSDVWSQKSPRIGSGSPSLSHFPNVSSTSINTSTSTASQENGGNLSASQVSRSSVVMFNTTEFGTSKKYKPAGTVTNGKKMANINENEVAANIPGSLPSGNPKKKKMNDRNLRNELMNSNF